MKNNLGKLLILILLIVLNSNFVFSQSELNKVMRDLTHKIENTTDSLNLTELDIYSLPRIENTLVEKHELIKLNYKKKYAVQSIEKANCTFIYYHEWENYNLLLVVYFPSEAGAGSPTLQFTTITKSGKIIDRKLIPYLYFIDPGYEPTQTLKIYSESKFEIITREIKRDLINQEFVFKSDEIKSERFSIKDGKIENAS